MVSSDAARSRLSGTQAGGKDDSAWSFDASRSLSRAQGGQCFAGVQFYLTSGAKEGQLEKGMPAIIENAGGAIVKKSPPEGTIVVASAKDEREYKPLLKKGLTVLKFEHLMTCVLQQELNTDEGRLG